MVNYENFSNKKKQIFNTLQFRLKKCKNKFVNIKIESFVILIFVIQKFQKHGCSTSF